MTVSTSTGLPRRLPVVPVPLPDEALLSWLDHLSTVYGVNRTVAAQACGATRSHDNGVTVSASSAQSVIFGMADDDVRRVRAATGLMPAAVRRMTWTGFAGSALPEKVQTATRWENYRTVKANWINPSELRFCPQCVDERGGRWSLAWSTPWVFACLRHQRYLLSGCPVCRMTVRAGEIDLARGACRGSVRDPVRREVRPCSIAYRDMVAPLLRDPMLGRLQNRLDGHLAVLEPCSGTARADLSDLAAMADLALFLATPDHLSGADPVVLERFTIFSRRYSAASGRLMTRKDRDSPEMFVRTACLRIAAQIVFSKDPWSSAMELANFMSRPLKRPVRLLHQSWLKHPLPGTTERLSRIVSGVRAPASSGKG